MPNHERQAQCVQLALRRAGLAPEQIDIVSTHATATPTGDTQECAALRNVFGKADKVFGNSDKTHFNNTKSFIGHSMGAAGALELAGNLDAFDDGVVHPTIKHRRIGSRMRIARFGR